MYYALEYFEIVGEQIISASQCVAEATVAQEFESARICGVIDKNGNLTILLNIHVAGEHIADVIAARTPREYWRLASLLCN